MKFDVLDTIDVVTGGDPEAALANAVAGLRQGLFHISLAHDPGCPCLGGEPVRSCSCEILRLTIRGRS